jgi:hypothetical protein
MNDFVNNFEIVKQLSKIKINSKEIPAQNGILIPMYTGL